MTEADHSLSYTLVEQNIVRRMNGGCLPLRKLGGDEFLSHEQLATPALNDTWFSGQDLLVPTTSRSSTAPSKAPHMLGPVHPSVKAHIPLGISSQRRQNCLISRLCFLQSFSDLLFPPTDREASNAVACLHLCGEPLRGSTPTAVHVCHFPSNAITIEPGMVKGRTRVGVTPSLCTSCRS